MKLSTLSIKTAISGVALALISLLLPANPVSAVPSTSITLIRLAIDGFTPNQSITFTYQELEENFEIFGDGETHYYHQGPVMVDNVDDRWNPAEDTNFYDFGALMGTNLVDLCEAIGGMSEGQELKLKATDGWSDTFAYKNVYEYSDLEGPMVLTWYKDGKYPDSGYSDGMRVVWFADTSTNPDGLHVFGNWDWHEAADEQYWYYNHQGTELYPTTSGLSGKMINTLYILTDELPFWDYNNDHACNVGDIVALGSHWGQEGEPGWIEEDANQDGVVNILDVVKTGFYWQRTY